MEKKYRMIIKFECQHIIAFLKHFSCSIWSVSILKVNFLNLMSSISLRVLAVESTGSFYPVHCNPHSFRYKKVQSGFQVLCQLVKSLFSALHWDEEQKGQCSAGSAGCPRRPRQRRIQAGCCGSKDYICSENFLALSIDGYRPAFSLEGECVG